MQRIARKVKVNGFTFDSQKEQLLLVGHDKGYTEGHNDGYGDGYSDGYEDGIKKGIELGRKQILMEITRTYGIKI